MRRLVFVLAAANFAAHTNGIRLEEAENLDDGNQLAQSGADAEIISLIVKPFISILEKVLLGKPDVSLEGSAAEKDGLHVKYKDSKAKVKVEHSATYGKAPKIY